MAKTSIGVWLSVCINVARLIAVCNLAYLLEYLLGTKTEKMSKSSQHISLILNKILVMKDSVERLKYFVSLAQ